MSTTESGQIHSYAKWDKPLGVTYGAWTVKWWQWVLSDSSVLTDETGDNWNVNQPSAGVWFLAGNLGSINKNFPHRSIKRMQGGRSILFPVLNCEANSLEYPDLKSHEDLVRHVLHDVDTIVKKEVYINGERSDAVRVQSDPKIFNVTISQINIFGGNNHGSTEATADGYWMFLKPLPLGDYVIHFEGSCELGRLNSGASYELNIV